MRLDTNAIEDAFIASEPIDAASKREWYSPGQAVFFECVTDPVAEIVIGITELREESLR